MCLLLYFNRIAIFFGQITILGSMEFRIDLTPVAQCRPRFTRNGRVYDPMSGSKQALKRYLESGVYSGKRAEGPIEVGFTFLFKAPNWWLRGQKNLGTWRRLPHIAKPDIDNLCKYYLDAFTGTFWLDDKQVCGLSAKKMYCESGAIVVSIKPYEVVLKENLEIFESVSRVDIMELASLADSMMRRAHSGLDVKEVFGEIQAICKRLAKVKV